MTALTPTAAAPFVPRGADPMPLTATPYANANAKPRAPRTRCWVADMRALRDAVRARGPGAVNAAVAGVYAAQFGRPLDPFGPGDERAVSVGYFDRPESVLGWLRPAYEGVLTASARG